jgi:hypothetical protein
VSYHGGTLASGHDAPAILYRDPLTSRALRDLLTPAPTLGMFPATSHLGFFGIDDAFIASAVPLVRNLIGSHATQAATDPVSAVWKAIPADAVNARVGADGWWYDLADGHRLEHEEAALRQQQLVAGTIGASVGTGGWWVDNADGHQLSHAEAYQRYQQLHAGQTVGGTPIATNSTPWAPSPTGPIPFSTTGKKPTTAVAGISPTTLLVLGGVGVVLLAMSGRRGRA